MKIKCRKCGESEGKIIDRIFVDGTMHKELRCGTCDAYQRFLPQEMERRDAANYEMPFGKHQGVKIENLPHDYVSWLAQQKGRDKAFRAARRFLDWPEIS